MARIAHTSDTLAINLLFYDKLLSDAQLPSLCNKGSRTNTDIMVYDGLTPTSQHEPFVNINTITPYRNIGHKVHKIMHRHNNLSHLGQFKLQKIQCNYLLKEMV